MQEILPLSGLRIETTMVGTVEVERRLGRNGQQYWLSGNGRLGFDLDDGLVRGGTGFVQTGVSRRAMSTEVTDYFLETRRMALGQDLVARLGTQNLPAENLLLEDGSWRGATLRLIHPGGRSDIMAFAMQPGEASCRRNLTGLEDPDARLAGIAGHMLPIGNSSLRTDLMAFGGQADLGDGKAGEVKGAGWRVAGPIGGDLVISAWTTRAQTRGPTARRAMRWAMLGQARLASGCYRRALKTALSSGSARRGPMLRSLAR